METPGGPGVEREKRGDDAAPDNVSDAKAPQPDGVEEAPLGLHIEPDDDALVPPEENALKNGGNAESDSESVVEEPAEDGLAKDLKAMPNVLDDEAHALDASETERAVSVDVDAAFDSESDVEELKAGGLAEEPKAGPKARGGDADALDAAVGKGAKLDDAAGLAPAKDALPVSERVRVTLTRLAEAARIYSKDLVDVKDLKGVPSLLDKLDAAAGGHPVNVNALRQEVDRAIADISVIKLNGADAKEKEKSLIVLHDALVSIRNKLD
ncbi:MAG: hypothetical protein AAFU72_16880 [Pseudomonadota bacterium]